MVIRLVIINERCAGMVHKYCIIEQMYRVSDSVIDFEKSVFHGGYMQEDKLKKIEELGFDVSEKGRNEERFVSFESVPAKDMVLKMLKFLDFEDCILFWDYYHVTVTDPGGYVTAYMLDENRAVYMEGNHGWSSKFKVISVDELAEMVIKNWNKDCDGGMYLNRIQIRPHYEPERDKYLYNIV